MRPIGTLLLVDPNPLVARAWRVAFADVPGVEVHNARFEDLRSRRHTLNR